MKYLLVVGSREFHNYTMMQKVLDEEINKDNESVKIVSGGAKGTGGRAL